MLITQRNIEFVYILYYLSKEQIGLFTTEGLVVKNE